MKANELMIGDILKTVYNQKIIKVKEIKQSCIYTEGNGYEYNEIEPIPLTPEILEKNEFDKYDFSHIEGQYKWVWWDNIFISVTLWCRELNNDTKDGMMLKIEAPGYSLCLKVNYVHDLQHTLRLCKIKKDIEL